MGFLSRFKKDNQQKDAVPIEVEKKTETVGKGTGVTPEVENANDDSEFAIVLYSYENGKQPKTDVIRPFPTAVSFIAKDGVYSNEKISGYIRIEDYNEGGKKEICVLSVEANSTEITIPLSVRVPGAVLDGTLRCSVKFEGEPIKLLKALSGEFVKKDIKGGRLIETYATARDLKEKYITTITDISRLPLFREKVYEDSDVLRELLAEKMSNDNWFMSKGLSISDVFLRFDQTELEKIEDMMVRNKYAAMSQRAEEFEKSIAAKSAAESKESIKDATSAGSSDDVKQI